MDFVSAWKAVSVGLTALFGLLGLLTEYKDKDTGKTTTWGKVALTGILISGVFGVIAQLKESSDQEKSGMKTAQETLTITQKTDKAVREVQRVLSPFDISEVTFSFEIPCGSSKYQAFCSRINKLEQPWKAASKSDWSTWPSNITLIVLDLDFVIDADDARAFQLNDPKPADLQMSISANQADKTLWAWRRDDDKIVIGGKSSNDSLRTRTNGKLKSMLDLPGTVMFMSLPLGDKDAPRLDELRIDFFEISLQNSQEIRLEIGRFEKVILDERPAYRYAFQ